MARKRPPTTTGLVGVFRHPDDPLRAALYARVSTREQQTLPAQATTLREHAARRGWVVALEVADVGSGAKDRPLREGVMEAAHRREIDVVVVARLDRWGRSLADLVRSLGDLQALGVAFVSLGDHLDLTTPSGRAMVGMISVFAEFERDLLRERVRAGIENARAKGIDLGRPRTITSHQADVHRLVAEGLSKKAIAARLGISRDSVRRLLAEGPVQPPIDG